MAQRVMTKEQLAAMTGELVNNAEKLAVELANYGIGANITVYDWNYKPVQVRSLSTFTSADQVATFLIHKIRSAAQFAVAQEHPTAEKFLELEKAAREILSTIVDVAAIVTTPAFVAGGEEDEPPPKSKH